MFYTEWVRKGCHWMASVSNAWRYEFRNSAKIGLSEGLLFGISMIPRWFANATRPQPFKAVKISENAGTPVAGDKVKVFVRNGLLFPRFQAEGENRPKYDDELPGGSTRQKKLMEEVDQLDGDVVSVCYLESHCGDEFEGQANTDLGKKGFVEAACDVRKSSKIFGSGIYCATKNPNVKRRFYPFQNVGGEIASVQKKGFSSRSIAMKLVSLSLVLPTRISSQDFLLTSTDSLTSDPAQSFAICRPMRSKTKWKSSTRLKALQKCGFVLAT